MKKLIKIKVIISSFASLLFFLVILFRLKESFTTATQDAILIFAFLWFWLSVIFEIISLFLTDDDEKDD